MENWIFDRVKTTATRRVVLATILAAFVLWLFFFSDPRYIRNFVFGPYPMPAAALDSIKDIDVAPRYFVRVTASKTIDTGIHDSWVDGARDVQARFYAMDVGGRYLVVQRTEGAPTVVEGELKRLPADFFIRLRRKSGGAGLGAPIYPFTVQDGSFRDDGILVGVFTALFFLVLYWAARKDIRHWRDPATHPAMIRAAKWGDPISIGTDAQNEERAPRLKGGGWRLGAQYLVRSTPLSFDLMRLSDVVWAHMRVRRHSIYFVPVLSVHFAELHDTEGTASIWLSKANVGKLLAFVEVEAPWAVLGYSKEVARSFLKDRAGFLALVEERKRQWKAGYRPDLGG